MKDEAIDEPTGKWMSPVGDCDICKVPLAGVGRFVDGKTAHGPWGCLCEPCHQDVGVGLGSGLGQLYSQEGGRGVKIGG